MKVHQNILKYISLEGRVAVVSGAAPGLGLGLVKKMAEAGANIALLYIRFENGVKAQKEIEAIDVKAIFIKSDVRSLKDCINDVIEVIKAFRRIDILHNFTQQ